MGYRGGSTTGPTIQVSTAEQMISACNGGGSVARARAGQTVILAADLATGATALNPAAGVTIELGEHTLAGCFIQHAGGLPEPLVLRNGIIDSSGLTIAAVGGMYGVNDFRDGRYRFEGVAFVGNNQADGGNLVTFVADNSGCQAELFGCRITGPGRDCLSAKSPGGTTVAAQSLIVARHCELDHNGPNSNDQMATSHAGVPMWLYDCYLHDPGHISSPTLVAPDSPATEMGVVRCRCLGGKVTARVVQDCHIETVDSLFGMGVVASGAHCRISNNVIVTPSGTGLRGIVANSGAVIQNNLIRGFANASTGTAIYTDDNPNTKQWWIGNTILECQQGLDVRAVGGVIHWIGNTTLNCSDYDALFFTGSTLLSRGNWFQGAAFYTFTPDVTDRTGNPT